MSQPQSPAQILKSVEKEERGELERIIADLEEEQRCYKHAIWCLNCHLIVRAMHFLYTVVGEDKNRCG